MDVGEHGSSGDVHLEVRDASPFWSVGEPHHEPPRGPRSFGNRYSSQNPDRSDRHPESKLLMMSLTKSVFTHETSCLISSSSFTGTMMGVMASRHAAAIRCDPSTAYQPLR